MARYLFGEWTEFRRLDEADGGAGFAGAGSAPDAVDVGDGCGWLVVLDDVSDVGDVHAAGHGIGGEYYVEAGGGE